MSKTDTTAGRMTPKQVTRVLDPSARNALLLVGYLAAVGCSIAASLQLGSTISSLQGAIEPTELLVQLAVALLVYAPVFCIVVQVPARRLARLQRDGIQTQDAWLGESKLAVEARQSIRALHAEAAFKKRYDEKSAPYLRFILSYRFNEALVEGLPIILCVVLQVSMMGIAALRAVQGAGGVGDILVAYQLSAIVQSPLTTILQTLSGWKANRVHFERLGEVAADGLEVPARTETPTDDMALCEVSGRFDAVGAPEGEGERTLFSTPGFTIRRGELVVIKGENGSGKSTLLDLLAGLGDQDAFAGEDSLSLGERQKVGLIRALSRTSDVLFLDEPLTNLDIATSKALCDYLVRLRGTKTVVAIMHSADLDVPADAIWEISDHRLSRTK